MITYRRELLVIEIGVGHIVDLRVENGHYFFGAHAAHLEIKVGDLVESRCDGCHLDRRGHQSGLKKSKEIHGQIGKCLRHARLSLLHGGRIYRRVLRLRLAQSSE